ncbi:MAG: GreA/GreB family elongation factor [Planctomycetes bacterium]|nr:GreA/GreB family elongation factor [Planctomycetota bacterium]MCB9910470.1 GreA/GreB family elongation factor [Planctomycetota bacterium]MCB9912596.1 GreA/GreB family elongation factor [Planctomycetota bacterium]
MILSILVAREKWEAFDDAWKQLMGTEDPIDDLLNALRLAGEKKRIARCMGMAVEHATLLEAADRPADGARILGQTLIAGGNPAELTDQLMRLSEAGWGKESWWEHYRDLAGLHAGAPDLRAPWRAFASMCALVNDTVVIHPGGWGLGSVTRVLPETMEVEVTFQSGRKDRFPMKSAVDIFTTLPESDLRARFFRDPEGLKKAAKADPLEILEAVLGRHHGKATTAQIRNALMGIGIEGSAWSAWWRKVRKLAENSEWFEVAGSPQKSVVTRLIEAKSPSDSLDRQLQLAANLAHVHSKVRELFVGHNPEEALVTIGIQALEEAARNPAEPIEERLAAWLFLRDRSGVTPPEALEALAPYVQAAVPTDPSEPPLIWTLFSALPSLKDQERAASLLPELYGEGWVDVCLPHLQHAARGMVRPLVETYVKEGHEKEVLETYALLLSRPLRAPSLMVTLAARFEGEDLAGDFPTPVQRAQALLSLASHLYQARRGEPHLTRVSARLNTLLTAGEDPLLRRLLREAEPDAIRGIEAQYGRGIDSEFERITTELALGLDRQFFAAQGGPFWQGPVIWTTKMGLASRSAEFRLLTDVKIPENQDAIGRAASFGDLSENSEWEAAIEEQRNLTSRAKTMEEELRHTDLIENAAIPQDTVAPGTRVRYRELESGQEKEVVLLGPWDPETLGGTPVVSYRAPLAQGMLGRHEGDTCTLALPGGGLDVLILEIHLQEFETVPR